MAARNQNIFSKAIFFHKWAFLFKNTNLNFTNRLNKKKSQFLKFLVLHQRIDIDLKQTDNIANGCIIGHHISVFLIRRRGATNAEMSAALPDHRREMGPQLHRRKVRILPIIRVVWRLLGVPTIVTHFG